MSSLDSSTAFICFRDARDFLRAAIRLNRLGKDLPGEVKEYLGRYRAAKKMYAGYMLYEKERKMAELARMRYEER